MLLIGDVHGKIEEFSKLVSPEKEFVQIGDFGFRKEHQWFREQNFRKGRILFGNHDYYPWLWKEHSLGNWHWNEKKNTLFIRGAYSIDQHARIQGVDWFAEEQLSRNVWEGLLDVIEVLQPEIIVSHDCPTEIQRSVFGIFDKSFTAQGLQALWEIFPPKVWIFGHHHKSIHETINGTHFVCLNELEAKEI